MTSTLTPDTNLRSALEQLIRQAISQVTGLPTEECDPYLAMAKNPQFGDYQSNAMMALAKQLKTNPRELGGRVKEALESTAGFSDLLDKCELAGPGFLNLHLKNSALESRLTPRHLVEPRELPASARKTVVVDYSSPNIAKEMHVGHIRSTILGDAISRVVEHLGHRVIRQNHLGDWGTQFGMLVAYYRRNPDRLDASKLSLIEDNYREANELFRNDPQFEKEAKDAVVELHSGASDAISLWEKIVEVSKKNLHENYQRLQLKLGPDDDRGESFYNPKLSAVVQELKDRFAEGDGGLQVAVNEGAVCVFLSDAEGQPLFKNADDEPLPFIIQKSDGAFLYATTDIAALRYRIEELQADWLIYVTDNRQTLHFEMLFAAIRGAGYDRCSRTGENATLQHVTFGTILGPDRKPLKTRDGGTIKMSELLSEAVERAQEKLPDSVTEGGLSKEEVAERIGIGAVKYADLSQNRLTDYVFTWDKLLSLEGNTAAYLMYAYARLSKMLRESGDEFTSADISLDQEAERRLALTLCRFPETVESLTGDWRMNALTDHLYATASALMKFYDECPVLKEENLEIRKSRLALCQATAEVLKTGLDLLGIQTVDRM
ncbi:MAG: arginine--tRNA ligase [Candidatus Eremiobacteraeota bacterium]|nr:arginine--tRNA ligase [Candidatus Eremiobacteraeota bacterium]